MKKRSSALLILIAMMALGLGANAATEELQPLWFYLNNDRTELYITLPANPTTGFEWTYEMEDPQALELVQQEYIPDPTPEQLVGKGGTWTAAFKALVNDAREAKETKEAVLRLKYLRPWEDEADEIREITISISKEGQLEILSAEMVFPPLEETQQEPVEKTGG